MGVQEAKIFLSWTSLQMSDYTQTQTSNM